jgi:hypothetical protein
VQITNGRIPNPHGDRIGATRVGRLREQQRREPRGVLGAPAAQPLQLDPPLSGACDAKVMRARVTVRLSRATRTGSRLRADDAGACGCADGCTGHAKFRPHVTVSRLATSIRFNVTIL